MRANFPANEAERVSALHACGVLDTLPEAVYDDIVRMVALVCRVPIAAVSLIDSTRQWFKARTGVEICEVGRDVSLCAHAILEPGRVTVVPDVTRDRRFSDNPFVLGAPHVRFYASAPLVSREGFALGSLCALDVVPRHLEADQVNALATLARQVVRELESRQLVAELAGQKSALDQHAIVVSADLAWRITHVNDRFCAASQYTRAELLDPSDLASDPSGAGTLFTAARATVSRGATWDGEVKGRARDGSAYWLQATVVPMKDAAGKTQRYVAIGTEISERKLAEEKLRQSEYRCRELIEALPAAIYTTDREGRITMFNRAAVEFSGRVPRLGSDSWCVSSKLFTADGLPLPHDQCPMAVSLREGRPVRGAEAIAERPDGSRVNFIPYPTPLYDASGALVGGVNMLVDITARKRDEENLRLLGSALQQAQESIVITDAQLAAPGPRILFVNSAFTNMTGFSSAEALGQTPRLTRGPLTDPAVIARLDETLAGGRSFEGEAINYRKDGSTFDLEWRVGPIRNQRGEITHFVTVQRDVSGRKAAALELVRAREAALESARLKSRFLANMSHELRTPLNTINGVSATLAEQDLSPQVNQAAKLILQCGEALLENIQTILTHSSLETGKMRLEAKPFSFLEVFFNALRITGEAAQKRGIDLGYYLDPAIPAEVVGDPFRLQQVLVNLIANAIKFTEEGRVFLKVRTWGLPGGGRQLQFAVADTGIGISRESLGKLFKPFFQADDSTTRRHEGTGLGLSIAKSLVELMGGKISVKSRPGVGSVFRFTVPLAPVVHALPVFASVASPGIAGKSLSFPSLDHSLQASLRAMAQAWGLRVVEGNYGEPAAADCPVAGVDFSIQRVPLAGSSARGHELEVRAHPQPVLGLPGVAPVALRSACLALPVNPVELARVLGSLVGPEAMAIGSPGLRPFQGKLADRFPLRILAADDIATNREVIKMICKHHGYHVDVVENGAEVLQRLKTHTYDLLLLDVQMPVLDGISAAREICLGYPLRTQRPRIVAVTAGALPTDREHCLDGGMDDYLCKPVLPKHLAACIERLFGAALESSPGSAKPQPGALPPVAWLDLSHLAALCEGMDEASARPLLTELFLAVEADFQSARPRLAEACATRQGLHLSRCVHGLKGCVLSIGWIHMARRCAEVLESLKAGSFASWAELPGELDELFRASSVELERSLPGLFSSLPPPA